MAYFSVAIAGGSAMSNPNLGNSFNIYYQSVRGLRAKQLEFYDVCTANFDIICLCEIWSNDQCYDHNLFPRRYTVYRCDWAYVNKACGGGVLTAIATNLGSCSHRYDLELCSENVRVEIPTSDGISMLIGNYYCSLETKPELITAYVHHLKNILDTILASFY
jgi:hypothetical protein